MVWIWIYYCAITVVHERTLCILLVFMHCARLSHSPVAGSASLVGAARGSAQRPKPCTDCSACAAPLHTHPLHSIGTRSTHFPCIEIRRAARPPQKGQNGYLAVRPGWRPSGVIAEARNARPSMSDMPWLGPARLPPSRSPRSIRPWRSVGAVPVLRRSRHHAARAHRHAYMYR